MELFEAPASGRNSPKRIGTLVLIALLLIVPPVLREAIEPLCGDGGVLYEGGCIARDRLIILSRDGQSRAVIEATVAKYGGVISAFSSDDTGTYGIDFPRITAAGLDEIRAQLLSDGFNAFLSPIGELFASRTLRIGPILA